MTGPDTGPDSPASPADTVSGGTENGEIRLDTVQAEPAVLPSNAGHGLADFGGMTASAPVLPRTENRKIRLDAVQASRSETTKVRHDPVQTEAPADWENPALLPQKRDGQDSREFCLELFQPEKTDKKHKVSWICPAGTHEIWERRTLSHPGKNQRTEGQKRLVSRTKPSRKSRRRCTKPHRNRAVPEPEQCTKSSRNSGKLCTERSRNPAGPWRRSCTK